jgi:hypothetical protein
MKKFITYLNGFGWLIGGLFLATMGLQAATPLHFTLHYVDRNTSWACGVMQTVLVDLNNDGKLDWTVGNCETDASHPLNLFWYEYQTPDHWVKHTIYGASPGAACAAAVPLDLNHDGWKDLIAGRYLFVNPGRGTSWTRHDIGTATAENAVHDMVATDVNGDGRLDVICLHWYTGKNIGIYWYEQPVIPTQTWTAHFISSGLPASGYKGIHAGIDPDCLGDFNGDGRMDIACALGWIEKNDAAGTRWIDHWNPEVFLGVDGTYHVAVRTAVRDLNGDGYPDIVQAECDTATPVQIAWLKNDGHGRFTRQVIRQGYTEDYHSLVVADLDGDGDLDLLTGAGPLASGPNAHSVFVFENTAGRDRDPQFVFHDLTEFLSPADAAALRTAFASDHEHDARFGDVDGDGRIDVVLKGYKAEPPAPFLFLQNSTRSEPKH